MGKLFDFGQVWKNIPELLEYLPITLELALLSMVIGLLLGLLLAIIKIKEIPVLRQIAAIFVSVIRGTPVLVQLYIVYFGVPMFFKYLNNRFGTNLAVANIPGFFYAVLALGLNSSAFSSEMIRSALLSVSKGQIEAASALGMTYGQALRRIILPEALTVALPTIGNTLISSIKGTSLAFTCAVVEMTAQGKIIGGRNYRYFEVYISLAIIYWAVTIIIEQILKYTENRLAIPDQVETYVPGEETQKKAGGLDLAGLKALFHKTVRGQKAAGDYNGG
jgi:polar amino acid transport system permease protein